MGLEVDSFVNLASVLRELCVQGSRFVSSNLFTKMTVSIGFFALSHRERVEKNVFLGSGCFLLGKFHPRCQ